MLNIPQNYSNIQIKRPGDLLGIKSTKLFSNPCKKQNEDILLAFWRFIFFEHSFISSYITQYILPLSVSIYLLDCRRLKACSSHDNLNMQQLHYYFLFLFVTFSYKLLLIQARESKQNLWIPSYIAFSLSLPPSLSHSLSLIETLTYWHRLSLLLFLLDFLSLLLFLSLFSLPPPLSLSLFLRKFFRTVQVVGRNIKITNSVGKPRL